MLRFIDPRTVRVKLIIAVYTDNMIVAGNDGDYEWLREVWAGVFPVKNLGPLTRYIGCAVERDEVIKVLQRQSKLLLLRTR